MTAPGRSIANLPIKREKLTAGVAPLRRHFGPFSHRHRHQQAQIDLPQVASLLFDMATMGQLGRGTGIDVGEEVGAVGWASRIALLPMFRWKMWMPFWSTKVLVALSEGATLAAPQRTTAPLVDGGEVARGDEMRRSMLFPAGAGRIQLISPRR